jgi:hypothetical protein
VTVPTITKSNSPLKQRSPDAEQDIRAELTLLRARYDSGAVSQAVFFAIRALEVELAWIAHRRSGRDE